jgi:outer membrane lipoprotein SlyB
MNASTIRCPIWKRRLLGFAVVPGIFAVGCQNLNNTEKGVGAGGLIGAGTGALIGKATGHTGAGALIGAGIGAVSGGLVGNAVDESEKNKQAAIAAAQQARGPLGVTDVVQLARQHISDNLIIEQIRVTGSVFHLSAQDIVWLKQNGVSDAVIYEMQVTAQRPMRRVYSSAPCYPPANVVVVEEAPPPVGVGFGVGYTHYGRWH